MKIYDDNGYIDIEKIINLGYPFIFVVGNRASGKTYGALKTVYENRTRFIYMRRTQSQADIIAKQDFSPFKKLNEDLGILVETQPITRYNAGFYNHNLETDEMTLIGYTAALSTLSNIRGADLSDAEILIYDEFIPEKHERPIKAEGDALFNAYETINRNRELNGEKPLILLCLANANDLGNPVFLSLGLVSRAEHMRQRGQETYFDKRRGIALFILSQSPIAEKKRETVLYKLTRGSEFERMAIDNEFNEEKSKIASRRLIEYKPVVNVGEITIYQHKSNSSYYVSEHLTGTPAIFTAGDTDLKRFRIAYSYIWREYLRRNVVFESYLTEILFNKYFGY